MFPGAGHGQKSLSQHLLRIFLLKELQRQSRSINILRTNSYLYSVLLLLCLLSLFEFPIKAKLGLKGSAPLSKDLFWSIVIEVNALRREMYLKERLKYLPSLNSRICHTAFSKDFPPACTRTHTPASPHRVYTGDRIFSLNLHNLSVLTPSQLRLGRTEGSFKFTSPRGLSLYPMKICF